jgi:predicted enzyme related to lactoylglutathione lyase
MGAGTRLTNIFAFTDERDAVVRFFEDILGAHSTSTRDDSAWFDLAAGATFTVHDRADEPSASGFVPWFHVDDVADAFGRAEARGAAIGAMRDGYFFARDPDGRVFGVRQWR